MKHRKVLKMTRKQKQFVTGEDKPKSASKYALKHQLQQKGIFSSTSPFNRKDGTQ